MKSRILTIVAGLSFVLAGQASLTAAATHMSGASASGPFQGHVSIHVRGKSPETGKHRGRFTSFGAISDRGRFVDRFSVDSGGYAVLVRTLFGAKGTIRIRVGERGPRPRCGFQWSPRCGFQWRITKGTKVYAGLRGRGLERGFYNTPNDIRITMNGTVSQ